MANNISLSDILHTGKEEVERCLNYSVCRAQSTEGKKNEQIKSNERVKNFGEVFTNEREVKAMCDLIPPDIWEDVNSTFLEPCCGEGVFVLEILRRKFSRCKKRKDYTAALASVYGMELQEDNVKICIENIINLCMEYFRPTKQEFEIINNHIIQADSLKIMAMMNDDNLKKSIRKD